MPHVIPPSQISTATFAGNPPAKRGLVLPPRPRELIEMMVWEDLGAAGNNKLAVNLAAARMGITPKAAKRYLRHPMAKSYYLECIELFHLGERPRNLQAAVQIRDDPKMKQSAAGARARVEAMRFIQSDDPTHDRPESRTSSGHAVMPGIVVQVNVGMRPEVSDEIILVGSVQEADPSQSESQDAPLPR